MTYASSSNIHGWPAGSHAFMAKQLGVALDHSQWRPLSLKNAVAKIIPGVMGKQLSVMASHVCHSE
eukprot:3200011-Amphidinium_carterae.1